MLRFLYQGVTFQEVPNELSMVFYILGCPRHCEGCHSEHFWDINVNDSMGKLFVLDNLRNTIKENHLDYKHSTALLFMGGDWEEDYFLSAIKIFVDAHLYDNYLDIQNKKLIWYVGAEINKLSKPKLAYSIFDAIKFGPYKEGLGGLNSITTNQIYLVKQWVSANYLFLPNGEKSHEHVYQ